ncbi:hypothetical protein N4T77_17025 [Clostridium sp. CX1]|uniref:hypothetical protein n=1 Tax=Clostridium sp. CX1 TaxID=2978346 RepID=UPI0021C072CD|nr:hypothetical protein [Clostridium sp. CX1]MCT8978293.1 hypothetical protein [Clostridium sp. CX1]
MLNIDTPRVYKDKIVKIKIDIEKAIFNKKWSEVAKLEAEKAHLESILNVKSEV